MASTNEELGVLLARLARRSEPLDDGTFLVASGGSAMPIALRLAPPIILARVVIGSLPGEGAGDVMRRLLELNATSLVHAAYGLEGEQIVLAAALEADHVDLNELEAVLADLDLALSHHVPELRKLVASEA